MRRPVFRHAETTVFGVTAAVLAGAVVWSAAANAETESKQEDKAVVVAQAAAAEEVRLFQVAAARINQAASREKQLEEVKILKTQMQLELFEDRGVPLAPLELKNLLELVGFKGQGLKTAWAVVMTESNGRPKAHNSNTRTGDNSYGLFQINMIGALGDARIEKFDLKKNEDLLDPVTNAEVAFFMSAGGTDFSAWKVQGYNQGSERFRTFLAEYPSKG
jgi:hypothetical protein